MVCVLLALGFRGRGRNVGGGNVYLCRLWVVVSTVRQTGKHCLLLPLRALCRSDGFYPQGAKDRTEATPFSPSGMLIKVIGDGSNLFSTWLRRATKRDVMNANGCNYRKNAVNIHAYRGAQGLYA